MTFFVVGVNHKKAPIELRERLAVTASNLVARSAELGLRDDLDEIVLLSTCNRVEIYATTRRRGRSTYTVLGSLCAEQRDFRSCAYAYEDMEAVRHLFRVAAGMDSMLLGETEISGQVKQAYETARAAKLTGGTLNRIFQSAFQVVKEIRTRTGIGRGAISVGGASLALAEKIFGHDLSKHSVMIIGAGQMGEACLRHLTKKRAQSILVSNRSFDRAVELAAQFGGRAVRFEDCRAAMADVDIIVASTRCPRTLLHRADIEAVMAVRRDRPMILIDISVPRNIDPDSQAIENVYLYNIDDLKAIVSENVRNRERELGLCNRIIDDRAAALVQKVCVEHQWRHQTEVPFHAGWICQSAAVVPD
jgi:glutamyl-tRNA reductase